MNDNDMCGRFVLSDARWSQYHDELPELADLGLPISFNIKPTNQIAIVINAEKPKSATARWGLIPAWHKGTEKEWKASTINARLEEAHSKPTFRNLVGKQHCLIPASGYYEWFGDPKGPHYIRPKSNLPVFFMAGLYSVWQGQMTAAIATRPADDELAEEHDRMPVILRSNELLSWLSGQFDPDLPGAELELSFHRVAPFKIRDDGADLIEPLQPAPENRLI